MSKSAQVLFILLAFIMSMITSCTKEDDESKSDTVAPVITILGANPIYSQKDSAYVDPGATASDDVDGDITSKIETTSNVNINIEGDYSVTYRVIDQAGNQADTFRVVKIRIF